MSRPKRVSNSPRSADNPSASACLMKGSRSPAAIASDNVTLATGQCPLVMIEWVDSAQPIPAWSYLASFDAPGIIRCASVGWLIRDDAEMKAVAPNMGGLNDERSVQVSGVIQIPTRCVVAMTRLQEPTLSAS